MPDKEIHVFDTSNTPLAVKGIVFELYDARSAVMLANDTTRDLSPPRRKWGVVLTFTARSGPVEQASGGHDRQRDQDRPPRAAEFVGWAHRGPDIGESPGEQRMDRAGAGVEPPREGGRP